MQWEREQDVLIPVGFFRYSQRVQNLTAVFFSIALFYVLIGKGGGGGGGACQNVCRSRKHKAHGC